MDLKAKVHFKHEGVFYAPGDIVPVDRWADTLIKIGRVERVEKQMKAAKAANKKNGYNRRDLTKTERK